MKLSHSFFKALHFYAYLNNFVISYISWRKFIAKGWKIPSGLCKKKRGSSNSKLRPPPVLVTSNSCIKAFQASSRRHLVFCKEPLLEDIQDYKVSLYSMYCKCKLVQFWKPRLREAAINIYFVKFIANYNCPFPGLSCFYIYTVYCTLPYCNEQH